MKKKKAKINLSIRIPIELNKRLEQLAAAMGLQKAPYIISLINQALEEKEGKVCPKSSTLTE